LEDSDIEVETGITSPTSLVCAFRAFYPLKQNSTFLIKIQKLN
jgi:hypothetical protein